MFFGIERDRMQSWNIVNVSSRTAQRFSICHVLYPASGKRRHTYEMQYNFIVGMIHRLHGLWFRRVKDMVTNHMWLPGSADATHGSRLTTLRRVLNCRPTSIFFRWGNTGLIRPCKQHKICPFCWGRIAAFMYRRVKTRIRSARKQHDNLLLTCRVISHFIPAGNFNSAAGLTLEEIYEQARTLSAAFTKHREAYKKEVKALQRNTVGSAWRIVVDPKEDGWNIEVRQLFLVKPGKRALPWLRCRDARTVYHESCSVCNDDAIYPLIGRFVEYPTGLLTSYAELTAAYLQATYAVRTTSGTGVFRTCGAGLLQAFKKEPQHGEETCTVSAKETGGDGSDPPTDAILV